MKRGEMIKLIKEHIVEHQFMERTKAAELLLNMLEEKGLKAPRYEITTGYDVVFDEKVDIIKYHQDWEDEV